MQYDSDTLRRLQLTLLEMLHEIDAVCRAHDINYFLDSGSALGAVRHGGFIPWDDDVDLGMMREDYNRFLAIAPEALPSDLKLIAPGETKHYSPMFAKVMKRGTKFYAKETIEAGFDLGIFIDIFPFDHLGPSSEVIQKQTSTCHRWQKVSYLYHAPSVVLPHRGVLGALERGACRVAHGVLAHTTNEESIYRHYIAGTKLGSPDSDQCGCLSYPKPKPYPKAIFLPTKRIRFEDGEFPVAGNVEGYLEISYGSDWNQLPPPEKRRNHKPEVLEF
ncbi:LicD family protein [Adlercreutzia shanghongiae]|uniref:LicD family protein n=1 Tax=Adlercreutzia shanghongiae TaxID=3111773 RepID=A0ABU6J082_9ACTN|nr:LicD family protein [Adlercreutzia sp. R22]MEC4295521.1 LicD family protein [Adlercreutzia sp. R22]